MENEVNNTKLICPNCSKVIEIDLGKPLGEWAERLVKCPFCKKDLLFHSEINICKWQEEENI